MYANKNRHCNANTPHWKKVIQVPRITHPMLMHALKDFGTEDSFISL
jgi:hypothetical protein